MNNIFSEIDLNNNKWEFKNGANNTTIIFDCDDYWNELLKKYCINLLSSSSPIKPITASTYILELRKWISELPSNTKANDIFTYEIEDYLIENQDSTYYISDFCNFYSKLFSPSVLRCFDNFKTEDKSSSKKGKTKLLPNNFFSVFVSQAYQDMINHNNPLDYRAIAAAIVLQSQIGIRTKEFLNLRISDLSSVPVNKTALLNFRIFKTADLNQDHIIARTFLNKLAYQAFLTLFSVCRNNRGNSDLLYVPQNKDLLNLNYALTIFSLKNSKVFNTLNNKWYNNYMHSTNIGNVKNAKNICSDLFTDADIIAYPHFYQFRVYRITKLIALNVPIEYIKESVGHKNSSMTYSYDRSADDYIDQIKIKSYNFYTRNQLNMLIDLANSNLQNDSCSIQVPNGYCHRENCEFRSHALNNFN